MEDGVRNAHGLIITRKIEQIFMRFEITMSVVMQSRIIIFKRLVDLYTGILCVFCRLMFEIIRSDQI